jgi:hypothetical protein
MRSILRGLALSLAFLPACAGWIGWGYGWCDPYYDPWCYDYYYYAWEPSAVAAADFDGDGDLDVAVADESASSVWLVAGEPGGGLRATPGVAPGVGTGGASLAAFDADGDGAPDLLLQSGRFGALLVYLGDGAGAFTPVPSAPAGVTVGGVAAFAHGRLDGDAYADLVTLDTNGVVRVLLGTGVGTFTDLALGDPLSSFLGPDAASRLEGLRLELDDFDATPGLDLLVLDGDRSSLAVASGRGDGTFAAPLERRFAPLGRVLDAAPVVVRRGAAADLAVLSQAGPDADAPAVLHVLRLDDGGVETGPVDVGTARALLARDLDDDGLTDLLLADRAGQVIRTLHARD